VDNPGKERITIKIPSVRLSYRGSLVASTAVNDKTYTIEPTSTGKISGISKIADKLYDPKLSRFLKNIFNFVMAYVKYETDSAFTEQLRNPLRTLKDQRGDCDCMSILIGSILYNKNISFCFRVAKYDANRDFSHVYVIVPRNALPIGEGLGLTLPENIL